MSEASTRPQPRCPICREAVGLRAQNPTFPFCSTRCREIDLGRWLQGDYVIASARSEDSSEDALTSRDED